MNGPWQNPAVVDFVERVGATAFETGAAVYIAAPHVSTVKPALIAAGISALKYAYLKIGTWQASRAGTLRPPPVPPLEV